MKEEGFEYGSKPSFCVLCQTSFCEVTAMKGIYLGKTKGFTLIELLIVVGIIALLVSILMPALRAVKERAKRVLCSSQLHQIGIVYIQYAQDFDGAFPCFNTNKGRYLFAVADDFMSWLGDGFASEIYPQLAPGNYGLPHKAFYCPGMQPDRFHGYMVDDWWWYYFDPSTGAKVAGSELVPSAVNGSTQCDLVNIGYALYVPRKGSCNPTCAGESPYLTSADWQLNPGREYRGPRKTSDLEAVFNPIMSDNVNAWYRDAATPSCYKQGLNAHPVYAAYFENHDRASLTGLPSREKVNSLDALSPHVSNTGLVTQANSLYSDGRVMENPGETIVPYYAVHRAQFW